LPTNLKHLTQNELAEVKILQKVSGLLFWNTLYTACFNYLKNSNGEQSYVYRSVLGEGTLMVYGQLTFGNLCMNSLRV